MYLESINIDIHPSTLFPFIHTPTMGSTPVRKTHTNTSDLLTWSEVPPPPVVVDSSATRSRQPSDRISKVLNSDQLTEEEAQSLAKRYFHFIIPFQIRSSTLFFYCSSIFFNKCIFYTA